MGLKQEYVDKVELGAVIRECRYQAGYRSVASFKEALERNTGYVISTETIYEVEQGAREPTLSLYMAIMDLLNPNNQAGIKRGDWHEN